MIQERHHNDITQKYERYGNLLYRICFIMLCNKTDAEDAVQDTFVKYMRYHAAFTSNDHEKAWFIRVATNVCRDRQRFRLRQKVVPLHDVEHYAGVAQDAKVLEEILSLPAKCKTPLYLHYFEGYSIQEIAQMLKSNESTVKSWLYRGRQKLKLEI